MTDTEVLAGSDPADLVRAASILRAGGTVVLPTDTLYGLAADILQPGAVEKVFVAKQRPPEARVPVLLATAADLPLLVGDVSRDAWPLIDRFWPGPLTIVFPASRSAPPEILQGSRTIAVRVPSSRPALRVLEVLGEPVTGTSANISGQPAAVTAEQALAQVGGRVDAVVVDDEAVRAGKPSTVVELTPEGLLIRRVGVLDVDQIRQVVGGRVVVAVSD